MARIKELEGIGAAYGEQLAAAGITTTEKLLEAAATRTARTRLAKSVGISAQKVLRWANMADLHRIKGIGEEFSDLLEAAGVDTVPELGRRNPGNLQQRLQTLNEEKRLTRRTPTLSNVEDWVAQARAMQRILTY